MRGSRQTNRSGAAAVEFAAIAPVLVLLVLGMIETGRGISVNHSLQNAARAGCRAAIIDGATNSIISDRVADGLAGTGISNYNVSVQPSPLSSADPGDPITVVVSVSYNDVSLVPAPRFLAGKTLTGSCSFPKE